ncbi:beta-1,3-glucan-binding protein [Anopheles nili]|uniref:beta-1,3-glucan-binding protein n=1 Tax=Anopheles nili TaxID=185578 RepID=UPI00237A2574|nr:beta-1,3-glucan-binding protein [Anopheles nili]
MYFFPNCFLRSIGEAFLCHSAHQNYPAGVNPVLQSKLSSSDILAAGGADRLSAIGCQKALDRSILFKTRYTMHWLHYLGLLFLSQAVAYTIPEVLFEYPTMRGFRASIPDTPGLEMFAFHARLNKPFERFEEGDYTEDIVKPNDNGQWTYETTKPQLPHGTVIYYWVYVQFENAGYWLKDQVHTVNRPKGTGTRKTTPKPTTTVSPCVKTVTTFNGGQSTCAGKLIFEDTFEQGTFAPKWQHEIRIPLDTESAEFLSYQNLSENSYIAAGRLIIVPTLVTADGVYTDERIRTGELVLSGCKSPTANPYECQRQAARSTILPPVVSAKLNTKNYFRFRYGRVEIRAKLPKGDWIFPQLYLQPYENFYGFADYASGQMWIAHVLANRQLMAADGKQLDGRRLRGGVLITNTEPVRSEFLRSNVNDDHFGDQFHVYGLVWTPEQIALTIDGFQYGTLRQNFRQLAHQRNLTQATHWNAEAPLAPFDREFYISLGVGVGGVKDFPDLIQTGQGRTPKPWNNTSPKAEYFFYQNRNTWYRTWTEPELTVDYVRVYAL